MDGTQKSAYARVHGPFFRCRHETSSPARRNRHRGHHRYRRTDLLAQEPHEPCRSTQTPASETSRLAFQIPPRLRLLTSPIFQTASPTGGFLFAQGHWTIGKDHALYHFYTHDRRLYSILLMSQD